MMPLDPFWKLIEEARAKLAASVGPQGYPTLSDTEALKEVLVTLEPADILEFSQRFDERLLAAYHWDLWAALWVIDGGGGDDRFEHFRAELILLGRQTFEAALEDADSLAELSVFPWGAEGLIYVPAAAYEERTGEEYPYGADGSNLPYPSQPAGAPWNDEDLPARLPRLWEKFLDINDPAD